MEGVREYLFSVTAASLLCALVRGIQPAETGPNGILKLVCELFLLFTVISPIVSIRIPDLPQMIWDTGLQAEAAASDGETAAKNSLRQRISEQTEAYILDKAAQLAPDLRVEITVSGDDVPIPIRAVLRGDVSPYARGKITQLIESKIGIPEEDQLWMP